MRIFLRLHYARLCGQKQYIYLLKSQKERAAHASQHRPPIDPVKFSGLSPAASPENQRSQCSPAAVWQIGSCPVPAFLPPDSPASSRTGCPHRRLTLWLTAGNGIGLHTFCFGDIFAARYEQIVHEIGALPDQFSALASVSPHSAHGTTKR